MRARRKAAGYRAVTRWEETAARSGVFSSHRLYEARSLATHAAIARKIERERRPICIHCIGPNWPS
jgi:hypothetical protein